MCVGRSFSVSCWTSVCLRCGLPKNGATAAWPFAPARAPDCPSARPRPMPNSGQSPSVSLPGWFSFAVSRGRMQDPIVHCAAPGLLLRCVRPLGLVQKPGVRARRPCDSMFGCRRVCPGPNSCRGGWFCPGASLRQTGRGTFSDSRPRGSGLEEWMHARHVGRDRRIRPWVPHAVARADSDPWCGRGSEVAVVGRAGGCGVSALPTVRQGLDAP